MTELAQRKRADWMGLTVRWGDTMSREETGIRLVVEGNGMARACEVLEHGIPYKADFGVMTGHS